jgi:hypothetical protein
MLCLGIDSLFVWLVSGADLFWEKSTVGWLLVADLFWEKSTTSWWLISQTNRARDRSRAHPFSVARWHATPNKFPGRPVVHAWDLLFMILVGPGPTTLLLRDGNGSICADTAYRNPRPHVGTHARCNTLKFSNFRMLLGRIIKQQFSHSFKIWPMFILFTGNLV